MIFFIFSKITSPLLSLKDQSSNLQPYETVIYSERSWKMEHFLFLRHVLNRCSFRDNCVWICYKLFVVIHKLFWIFCGKIDFYIVFSNFHQMNIVAIFIAKWDEQNDTKLSNLNIVLGYWNENPDSCFRFNNPKQFSNSIILVPFCSSHCLDSKFLIQSKFVYWQENTIRFF